MSSLKNLILSSFLLIADAVGQKLVGLISTVILARVLVPEDFGLIAVALIFMGFSEVLSETGSMQYLLRVDKIDSDIVNTAWTISVYTKLPIAIFFCLLAYPISLLYDDSRLTLVIIALMLVFIINTFRNPAEVYLKRAQTYQKIVVLNIVSKVIAVVMAITIAVIYESYWALVAGQFAGSLVGAIGSYIVIKHRPQFILSDSVEQWSFSKWMIPQSLFGFFRTQLDTIMVSLVYGKAELGSFHTMKYLAYLPSANFLVPAMQPLLVELAHFKHDKFEYSKRFNSSFFVPYIISIPITAIMFLYHDLVTLVVLGPQWVEYSLILGYFALLIPATIMFRTCARTLMVYAKSKVLLVVETIMFIGIYGTLVIIDFESLENFTFIRAILENVLCLGFIVFVSFAFTTTASAYRLFVTIILLVVGTVPTFYIVELVSMNDLPTILLLSFKTLLFTFIYLVFVLIFHYSFRRLMPDWVYTEKIIMKIIFRESK